MGYHNGSAKALDVGNVNNRPAKAQILAKWCLGKAS
jgi:hypothetical protein